MIWLKSDWIIRVKGPQNKYTLIMTDISGIRNIYDIFAIPHDVAVTPYLFWLTIFNTLPSKTRRKTKKEHLVETQCHAPQKPTQTTPFTLTKRHCAQFTDLIPPAIRQSTTSPPSNGPQLRVYHALREVQENPIHPSLATSTQRMKATS